MNVVVAESQPQVRFALRVMLSRRPDTHLVGEAVDSAGLLALLHDVSPNLVLLGWGSPGLTEQDLLERVLGARPGVCLIVLSERQDLQRAALAAGARAFVSKGSFPEELAAALDTCTADLAHG